MKTPSYTLPGPALFRSSDPGYPSRALHFLGQEAPRTIEAVGDTGLLQSSTLGLLCSARCRGCMILATYEFVNRLSAEGPTVVSGFHSPMERQCLEILLRKQVPVILCAARGLHRMRIPPPWRAAIGEHRLLLVSGSSTTTRRATAKFAGQRNRLVVALSDSVLIPYATEGGKTARISEEIARWGKSILTFRGEGSERLVTLGATAIEPVVGRRFFNRQR